MLFTTLFRVSRLPTFIGEALAHCRGSFGERCAAPDAIDRPLSGRWGVRPARQRLEQQEWTEVIGHNKTIWLTEWDRLQDITREKTNQIVLLAKYPRPPPRTSIERNTLPYSFWWQIRYKTDCERSQYGI